LISLLIGILYKRQTKSLVSHISRCGGRKTFSEIAKVKGKDISIIINHFLKKELDIHKDLTI